MFLWCNNLASSSKTARRIVFMVKHMPSPAIRMFNMTCLFEHTKLCLLGYYSCCWAVYPTFIRSVDFSRFHPKRRAKIQRDFPKLCGSIIWNKHWITPFLKCVWGGNGHTLTHVLVRPNPKSFAVWRFLGRQSHGWWMILPCMKIWQDFIKWFDLLAVLDFFFLILCRYIIQWQYYHIQFMNLWCCFWYDT